MPNIYYKKTNGKATDLQRKKNPDFNDILYESGEMPDIETLHDASYIATRDAALAKVEVDKQQRASDVARILPSRAAVRARMRAITNLPDLIMFVEELADIVYWQEKGTSD